MNTSASIFPLRECRSTWIAYAALLGLIAFVTFGSLSEHLFDADDLGYWQIMSVTLETDWTYFFSPERPLAVRPPSDLFFLISYALWGDNPGPPHILQIVFHVICGLLLAYTFRRYGISFGISLLAGLLFLMNITHFRVVQWITCMNYTVGAFFLLCTILAFFQFLDSTQRAWLFATIALLSISIFTHPGTLAAALFLPYLSWRKGKSFKQTLVTLWPLLAAAWTSVVIAYAISSQSSQVRGLSSTPDPINIATYFFWYVSRLVSQAHWLTANLTAKPEIWELVLGLCTCMGVFVLYYRRVFPVADWALWSLLSVLPFVYFPHVLLAGPSRHLYFSTMGSSLVFSAFIWGLSNWIAIRFGPSRGRLIFGIILIGVLSSSFSSLKRSEAMAFYSSGRNYVANGDLATGSSVFQRAIDHDPYLTPPDTYSRTALAYMAMGKSPKDVLQKGLGIYPDAPILNLYLGAWETDQQNRRVNQQGKARVKRAFSQSREKHLLKLDAATCYYNLGTHHFHTEKFKRAEACFRQSLFYRPDDANTNVYLGKTLQALGQTQAAEAMFHKAIQAAPKHSDAYLALGVLLDAQGKTDAAIKAYTKVLKIHPDNGQAHYHLAGALYSTGDLDSALQHFQSAIALNPQNPLPYRGLSVILADKGALEEVVHVLKIAARLTPDHADTWHSLAIVYRKVNRNLDAVDAYRHTMRYAPNDWEAHLGLAQTYESLHRIEEATYEYRQTLDLFPENQDAKNALQNLKKMMAYKGQ